MPDTVAVPGLGALEIDRCVGTEVAPARWILLCSVTSFADTSARDPHRQHLGDMSQEDRGVLVVDRSIVSGRCDELVEDVSCGVALFREVSVQRRDAHPGTLRHGVPGRFATDLEHQPDRRVPNHLYFAALLEPAIWGAELAVALSGGTGRARIYIVEPTGPFEDDPDVTNKRFPGNVTQSYRTRHPMRIVGEVESWEGHPPETVQAMLDNIAELRADGLDVIED